MIRVTDENGTTLVTASFEIYRSTFGPYGNGVQGRPEFPGGLPFVLVDQARHGRIQLRENDELFEAALYAEPIR